MARITHSLGGTDVLFRVPTQADLWDVFDSAPVLPTEPPKEPKSKAEAIKRQRKFLADASKCLALCALRPVLIEDCPVDLPPDTVSLKECQPTEITAVFGKLLEAAGYTGEAAEAVRPSSEGEEQGPDSSSSIDSPNGTADDPASS